MNDSTEIKIGKALEEGQVKQEAVDIKKALHDEINLEVASETQFEEENSSSAVDEDSRNILLMIAIIIGIFAFSIGGFKLYDNMTSAEVYNVDEMHEQNLNGDLDDGEGYLYNGYSFVKVDGLWWTEMTRGNTLLKVPLHFSPKEVEDIPISGELNDIFNTGQEVYITIDPDVQNKYYTLAVSELSFNTVKGIKRTPVAACTDNVTVCEGRPILSCSNTQGKPVIEFALANESSVELSGNCIKISGSDYNIVKAVNRLLYQWYGSMN